MPYIAPNNKVIQVEMRYAFQFSEMINTLWFTRNDNAEIIGAELPDLANALFNWWEDTLKDLQHTSCHLSAIYLRKAVGDPTVEYTLAGDATSDGTVSTDPLPGNVTFAIAFKTGRTGRSYRGRNYAIGMCESHQSNGIPNTTYINALTAAYQELLPSAGRITPYLHVVYSRFSPTGPRTLGVATPVETYVCNDIFLDSQRRRLIGRGR